MTNLQTIVNIIQMERYKYFVHHIYCMAIDNYKLDKQRKEPKSLSKLKYGELPTYPPIRTITNSKIIESLIGKLSSLGKGYVVMSWISPPFGRVVGYGIYNEDYAHSLSEKREMGISSTRPYL